MNNQIIYDRANAILNSYYKLGILEEDLNIYLNRTKSNFNNIINRIYAPFSTDDSISKITVENVLKDIIRDKIAKNTDTQ